MAQVRDSAPIHITVSRELLEKLEAHRERTDAPISATVSRALTQFFSESKTPSRGSK